MDANLSSKRDDRLYLPFVYEKGATGHQRERCLADQKLRELMFVPTR